MVSCLERDILSAEDLAAVRTAIELCHSNELKNEVLCAFESEYDRRTRKYKNDVDRRAKIWKEILENKTTTILENLGLRRVLLDKVRSLVILIGMRMLRWAKYNEKMLGLSREYSIEFLNSSFFTAQGIVDNKIAAQYLIKDSNLSTEQKYTLACLYCFTENIPDLFRQMSQEEKLRQICQEENEYNCQEINYPKIVKFWSDYLMGDIEKLRGENTLDQCILLKAIESGSKAAVEYCLEKTSLSRRKDDVIIDAAMETVKKTPEIYYEWDLFLAYFYQDIPNDDVVDILSFLLSKTSEEQKIEFLKKDIKDSQTIYQVHPRSRILEYFLEWPYQNYFMKTAKLMWDFLPEWTYAALLLKICYKISPRKNELNIGEEKSYDYQKLLKEFWIQSPDHFKRYVISDKEIQDWIEEEGEEVLNKRKGLLIVKLLTLKNYSYEDRKIFELILDSATEKEKESIISSKEGIDICIGLMEGEKWEILDEFLSECMPSKEEADEFKRQLSFTERAQGVCANFIKYKWDAAEFFVKLSSLSEEEIILFRRELIYSTPGRNVCWFLFLHRGEEIANRFCEWCLTSEEEIGNFKKELIFSVGVEGSADLIIEDKLEVVDEFINWSHLYPEDIIEFKKHLQQEKGNYICENLISGEKIWHVLDSRIPFVGGKWEQVEKFLTWCFSSEEEIRDFKKDRIFKISGSEIHFRLIRSSQWEEAETFFAWLSLSPEEVKELKKETLFNYEMANKMLRVLLFNRTDYEELSDFGSRLEAIGLLLRWFLTDKETVLEYRDHIKQQYESEEMKAQYIVVLEDFDSAIEQRLSDLDDERRLALKYRT